MRVYKAEREAGLAEAVASSRCVALEAPAVARAAGDLEKALAVSRRLAVASNLAQHDLFYIDSILVTAGWENDAQRGVPCGWNKNDDVFDPAEVWEARCSPEDKPVNDEHDCGAVVGHVTSNRPILEDGSGVPDDSDDLPGRFHILTAAVLYKVWDGREDLQKKVDGLLAEIAAGQRAVSMECLFKGFDYAVQDGGEFKTVARNKETAFLTKRLRAYGGDGTYEGKRVGRVLRNLVFSGMGVVKKPANPASAILSASGSDNSKKILAAGYSPSTANQQGVNHMAEADKKLEELNAENERLKEQLRRAEGKDLVEAKDRAEASAAALKKKSDELAASLAAKEQELKAASDTSAAHAAEVQTLKASLAEKEAELSKLAADKARADRLAVLVKDLKLDDAKAAEMLEPLAELSDEKFAAHVKAMTAWVTNNPQDGNTNFGGDKKVQTPPKSTPAPVGPKSTGKPAPMAGKGSESAKADVASLETAEANKDAALAVDVEPEADSVRKSIASFFSRGAEDQAE